MSMDDNELAELRALAEETGRIRERGSEGERDLVATLTRKLADWVPALLDEFDRQRPLVEAALKLRHAGDDGDADEATDDAIETAWAHFDEAIDAYEEANHA